MTALKRGSAATALSAGILLALAGLSPAQAATAARWRVDAVITPRAGTVVLSSVVATSRTNAWAAGTAFSEVAAKTENRLVVEHFSGRRWRQFPVPSRLRAVRLGAQVLVGASSASNVWVFELLPGHAQRILRWNGRRWIAMSAPSWVFRGQAGGDGFGSMAVFRNTAWVFSFNAATQPQDAARYLYGRWRLVPLPGIPTSAAAVAANDIWATGVSADRTQSVLMHWNGRSWTVSTAPNLNSGPIVSTNASSAWVLNYPTLESMSRGTWTTIALPSYLGPDRIATDGHGGVWTWGPHIYGGNLISTPNVFAHYSDGTWTQQNAPVEDGNDPIEIAAMTQVPGTATVFAVGWVSVSSSGPSGAILQYVG
jgi:hypothetical protein